MDGEEQQPIIDMEGAAPDMEGMEEGMDAEMDMQGMDGDMDDMDGENGMDEGMDDMEGDADAPVVGMDGEAEMSEAPSNASGREHIKDDSKCPILS